VSSIAGVKAAVPVLLDTCAAIWLVGGDALSSESKTAIINARSANIGVYVSPFIAWEVGMLVSKGRFRPGMATQSWLNFLFAFPGFYLASLPPEVLLASTELPGTPPNDPADRIVAATARTYSYKVVTRDRQLLSYAQQGHIQAVEC
jgi:PIN domain nuclease of toxin-antitoxin system